MKGSVACIACVACIVVATAAGCYREERSFNAPPATMRPTELSRATTQRPAGGEPVQPAQTPTFDATHYQQNAYAVSQGKRLFRWFNCNGCHGQGGGSYGPALMDAKWLYGAEPRDIYLSIVQGRPKGMPSFGGRIAEDQVWQLVAYVRSMSGQLRKDVAPSRADSMSGAPPENTEKKLDPVAEPQPQTVQAKP